MKTLYGITSIYSIGCTFVDWSIHWLSGQQQFYNCNLGWQPISVNPLTDTNAHNHPKNHPSGYVNTEQCVKNLNAQQGMLSLYPWPMPLARAAKDLDIDINQKLSDDNLQAITKHQQKDYTEALKTIVNAGGQLIYVDLPQDVTFYLLGPARTNGFTVKKLYDGKTLYSNTEMDQDFDDLFFLDSQKQWQELGLTNIWDQRERMALNMPWSKSSPVTLDYSIPHVYIDVRTLWACTERTVCNLIENLNLDISMSRLDHWRRIAEQWKNIQYSKIWFAFNCQHIVEAVVNGYDMQINLNFYQEAAVQHCLIYQHGLNLKTWQLEKFPNNTKQLHSLLEPNIHPL